MAGQVRWGWIMAVALGTLLGLLFAARIGVTGARLGPPDDFDRGVTDAETATLVP